MPYYAEYDNRAGNRVRSPATEDLNELSGYLLDHAVPNRLIVIRKPDGSILMCAYVRRYLEKDSKSGDTYIRRRIYPAKTPEGIE